MGRETNQSHEFLFKSVYMASRSSFFPLCCGAWLWINSWQNWRKQVLIFGYADDVAIVAKRNFLSILKERMDLRIIQIWCTTKGLINLSKTSAIIFIKKYKPEPIEPLKLWDKDIPSLVKYLEIILDIKLSWKLHLERKKGRNSLCGSVEELWARPGAWNPWLPYGCTKWLYYYYWNWRT